MRRIQSVLAAFAVAALVSAAVAAPACAESADPTYRGDFVLGLFPDLGCGNPATELPVAGGWNVTLQSDGTAVVHVAVFGDGKLFTAWGGNALHPLPRAASPGFEIHTNFTQLTPTTGEVFSLVAPLAPIGSQLTVVLATNHQIVFTFTPYFGCAWHKVIGVEG